MANTSSKLKILYVLEILRKYSDENHPLTATYIIEKLEGFGISAERKSVYADIELLCDFGFDIIKSTSPKGWFLASRELEAAEVYMLSDAVRSAKFISAKKTRELVDKLYSELSVFEAKRNKDAVYFSLFGKCDNESIYYNIDKINEAIKEGKQIKLVYTVRAIDDNRNIIKKSKEMTINPYALAWEDDCYYLLGNHIKYDNLIHLRLDRMSKVEVLKDKARHFSEVSDYKENFDVADYVNKLFGMHTGEQTAVELKCDKSIAEPVLDRFGEDIFIKSETEKDFSFSVKAVVSDALVTWIINYSDKIEVVKPENLKEMIKERALSVLKIYE